MRFTKPVFTPLSSRTWPELLTVKQTSRILGVSEWTLRKWDNEGKFKAVRVGRWHRRYRKLDVIKATQEGIK